MDVETILAKVRTGSLQQGFKAGEITEEEYHYALEILVEEVIESTRLRKKLSE